jgi:hypothetical protein
LLGEARITWIQRASLICERAESGQARALILFQTSRCISKVLVSCVHGLFEQLTQAAGYSYETLTDPMVALQQQDFSVRLRTALGTMHVGPIQDLHQQAETNRVTGVTWSRGLPSA